MAAGFEKYLNASSGRKVAGRPKRSSHDSIHTKTIALEHFSDSGSVVALKFDFPVPNGPSAGQLLPRITGKLLDFVSADPRMEFLFAQDHAATSRGGKFFFCDGSLGKIGNIQVRKG